MVLATLSCSSAPSGPAAVTVEFWAMGREGEVVRQLVPEFERRNPDVRVRVQQIPWSAAHEKLLTAFVGGTMPDVFQLGNTWIPELVALRAVEPLDGRLRLSASIELADYFPAILETNLVDGETYGVPWYVDTRVLFYRTDLLERAGYREPPRTWDAWVDAMTRVKRLAGEGGHAILLPLTDWSLPVILGLEKGAGLLRDGGRYGDFESAEFRAAFRFYLGLFDQGLAARTGEAQVANLYQDFAAGRFAFYVTGPWNIGEFARRLPEELRGRWTTAPLPSPDDRYPGVSIAGGASLALSRGSPRADAAWKLVEFLSEPATQVEFHRLTGDLPPQRSAWADPSLAGNGRAAAFRQQLAAARPLPKVPEWERIATRVAERAEAVIRGESTIEEALAGLDADVDAMLEKRRWMLARAGRRGEG